MQTSITLNLNREIHSYDLQLSSLYSKIYVEIKNRCKLYRVGESVFFYKGHANKHLNHQKEKLK